MSDVATNRAEEIVFSTLKLSSAERAVFWDRACSGDAALRAEVEKVWAECAEAEGLFDQCRPALNCGAELVRVLADSTDFSEGITAEFASDEIAGTSIGPYKLLQKLGEGGCGTVYMAEQEKPVRRRVALKVIKLGMDTKNVIARFEAERQALAMMDHPNIAHVFEAGATEMGRPYFVMELVRGVKVTNYCDENRLNVRQRLELFIQICGAIQHAHQKGIVHRDIKPSNILVTMLDGVPVPKVIDFGIAKATGGERLTDNTLVTACEQFVGTPAYMSPEQAPMSGTDVDTRSDIYSLGVLLYELLTGRTPFDQNELLKSSLDEMRRTLLEREPQRPSTKLDGLQAEDLTRTSLHRQVETPRLNSLLRGDLDWIVMKSLEKDRNRRYQTANGFGMDVQRYLNNEPVFARPPSRLNRLQKLVRRNKTTFAAIAAVSVALIAGFGTSTWLYFREREARREAESARRVETELRAEADARANISQAALLISHNEMAAADRLVDNIQVPVVEPSLEAAGVFHTLGNWNVTHGLWKVAADRFLQLEQANQVDKSDLTADETRDLLGAGPSLIVAGDLKKYHQFVQVTLHRFADTSDPVAAEEVMKNSLILPVDAKTLKQLEPLVKLLQSSVAQNGPEVEKNNTVTPWQPLALSLYEYRCGNFTNVIVWGQKCLDYSLPTPPRTVMAHIILAMAYSRLNQPENARVELAAGPELIEKRLPDGPEKIVDLGDASTGLWHDWVIAYLLLHEAEKLVK
jgi:eukaryotic-like serine/threonine-protein kinase